MDQQPRLVDTVFNQRRKPKHQKILEDSSRPVFERISESSFKDSSNSLVCFGMVWFGYVWFTIGWSSLVWFGLVWFGLVWSCLV